MVEITDAQRQLWRKIIDHHLAQAYEIASTLYVDRMEFGRHADENERQLYMGVLMKTDDLRDRIRQEEARDG